MTRPISLFYEAKDCPFCDPLLLDHPQLYMHNYNCPLLDLFEMEANMNAPELTDADVRIY